MPVLRRTLTALVGGNQSLYPTRHRYAPQIVDRWQDGLNADRGRLIWASGSLTEAMVAATAIVSFGD
jgi:hypothetical protein